MKKSTQRLFMMEMVLSVTILFISLSVTNLIFVRSMTQHQKNEAMIKMSETMVMISENIQSQNTSQTYLEDSMIQFDAKGNQVKTGVFYQLNIRILEKDTYNLYILELSTLKNEELMSWDVVKVVE